MALNRKRRAFVEEYLQCWNATEAARRAGYSSRPSGRVTAHRILADPEVQALIAERIAEQKMAADEVLLRLSQQARGDIGAFFRVDERWTEDPLPTQEIVDTKIEEHEEGASRRLYLVRRVCLDTDKLVDPRYSHLVKKFQDSTKYGLMIELHDAQSALTLLGKHLRLFADQVEHSGPKGGPIAVQHHVPVDLSKLTDEELDQLAGLAERLGGDPGGEGAPAAA